MQVEDVLYRAYRKNSAFICQALFTDLMDEDKQKFIFKILKINDSGTREDMVVSYFSKEHMELMCKLTTMGKIDFLFTEKEQINGSEITLFKDMRGSFDKKENRMVSRILRIFKKNSQIVFHIENQEGKESKQGIVFPTGKNKKYNVFYFNFAEFISLVARAERFLIAKEIERQNFISTSNQTSSYGNFAWEQAGA